VLVVEDEDAICEAVKDVLEEEGYEVVCDMDGRSALDRLRGGLRPGVILLDLALPQMNGDELLLELHKDPELAQLPVVIFTAWRDGRQRAEALGAAGFVSKPPALNDLLTAVSRYC
jgi:CheY-like chemotaxis protein